MRDSVFYRKVISHRAAVKALEDISCAFTGERRPEFYGYGPDSHKEIGGYDPSVRMLAEQVRKLVEEIKEYRKLKEALKPILNTRY
jgi:hypothetical protein